MKTPQQQTTDIFFWLFCIVIVISGTTHQTDMGSFYNCIISSCSINQSNYAPALISVYCKMIPSSAPDSRFVFVLCHGLLWPPYCYWIDHSLILYISFITLLPCCCVYLQSVLKQQLYRHVPS